MKDIIEVQDGTRYSAVSDKDHLKFLDETISALQAQLADANKRAEAAEAKLALVDEYGEFMRYAPPEPYQFDMWLARRQ